ncbi:MAG: DUF2165 domain-containing protein [Anaerolineae bacterium]|nr:DUF2165 domain-containing protein [Anaerolineae bacterium]
MPIRLIIRLSKAALSLSMGLFAAIVVFGNLTDYKTNYRFVSHVLSMDTTFPDSTVRKRAITSPRWYHIFYGLVIAIEAVVAVLCSLGGLAMLSAAKKDGPTFHQSKSLSIAGLTSGLMLWFTGFQAIASEWFGSWMSNDWNGLPSASRITQILSAMLVFVSMKNDD